MGRRQSEVAFTLIEFLIIVAISAIIGVASTLAIPSIVKEKKILGFAANEFLANLRDVRQRSISQDLSQQWGIHINANASGNDSYSIFYGADFLSGTIIKTVTFSPNIRFFNPPPGSVVDIIFEKITGYTLARNISFGLINDTVAGQYITINNRGFFSATSTSQLIPAFPDSRNKGIAVLDSSVNFEIGTVGK